MRFLAPPIPQGRGLSGHQNHRPGKTKQSVMNFQALFRKIRISATCGGNWQFILVSFGEAGTNKMLKPFQKDIRFQINPKERLLLLSVFNKCKMEGLRSQQKDTCVYFGVFVGFAEKTLSVLFNHAFFN